ncbi:hypothetical protein A3A46_03375 [Candidatus Roizmanbacteria bacterium RIFCSPLOWO2_01_FULL_37_13]|uniref:Thioredoxin-like fold domain-containing protein n=1 Tax=Candidatus Roizmanbacteria bacterium RIFCSPHIGHO2_02_FULL_38_11 TaxID=1802039 RepID=A0A1F7GWI5_9BACT|nr:MAG: hypothetical protein A3C25_02210 [Candidatus Roizmanbacteria bacterium RIFCSPHIGHO2_02_FULL_38_11]OGK33685.1 MAG: hypothetical protein A3F58_02295 [Candidatus Roizmanbacteria bacterium RIFCSPHIGHO2_12_FULL_37_9b]OGK43168.1 MAG: hypothetical protein A3A46_03375 [Candidatus Roizmanbacteria bacterium RIFCSPLOWO2_01_FULL_37_13]
MHWPKFVIENDKNRQALAKIGLITVLFFVAANIFLRKTISKNKEQLIISENQLAVKKVKFSQKIRLESDCPDERSGNPDATLTIKYFYSPVCFWCILEDQHFDELLQKEGQAFKLEKYSREKCADIMQKHKLSLTPSFVFSSINDSQEYTVDGYISKENLVKVICDVTGSCLKSEPSLKDKIAPESQKIEINFK